MDNIKAYKMIFQLWSKISIWMIDISEHEIKVLQLSHKLKNPEFQREGYVQRGMNASHRLVVMITDKITLTVLRYIQAQAREIFDQRN